MGIGPGQSQASITHRTLSGLVWMMSGSGLQAGVRIVVFVVLARLLTPSEFGVMSAATVVVGFSDLFSQLGMGPAVVQRHRIEERHIRTAFTASLLFGTILAIGVVAAAPLVSTFFGFDDLPPILRVLSLGFPLSGLAVVAGALLERALRFRTLAFIELTAYVVGYGAIGVGMAVAGFGVWALVLATLTQQALAAGLKMIVAGRDKVRIGFERRAFDELVRFGGGFTIARMLNYTALQADNVIAGRVLGAAALGLYSRAYQLLVFPVNLFGTVLDRVLFPAMAKVQHDRDRLAAAFLRGSVATAFVFVPISTMSIILAPELILTFLGPQWTGAIDPFRILAVGMVLRASYKMSDALARATGAVYRRAWRQAVYAGSVIVGSAVGARWGLNGLAAGVLAALLINFVLMSHLSFTQAALGWRRFVIAHVPAVGVGSAVTVLAWGIALWMRTYGAPDPATLGVAVAVPTVLVGSVLAWRQRLLGEEGRWMVDTLRVFVTNVRGARRGTAPSGE